MRINGKKIRDRIKAKLHVDFLRLMKPCFLAIVVVGDNPVVDTFVSIKKRFAEDIGVYSIEKRLPVDILSAQLEEILLALGNDAAINGIIIQLPLPSHLDTQVILNCIPESKDVDVLSSGMIEQFKNGSSLIMPPVVAAIEEICREEKIMIQEKDVVIIGRGRLVGEPASVWFKQQGARVQVIDSYVDMNRDSLRNADIVVSGAGSAGLIKPEMLKIGVVIIDAGTSESGGVTVGDADPGCEEVASIFTPVPGGVGPITVAMIFRNLLEISKDS